jgi:hypothetical protein
MDLIKMEKKDNLKNNKIIESFKNIKNIKWMQILFLFLMFYGIMKNKRENIKYLNKDDNSYISMRDHLLISEFRIKIDDKLDILLKQKEEKYIKISNELIKSNNFTYLYIYFSENIVVYFFKKDNDKKEKIYFEGLRKFKQINNFSIPKIINNKGILSIKDDILDEKGIIVKIEKEYIKRIERKITIIDSFLYLKGNVYKEYDDISQNHHSGKINIKDKKNKKYNIEMEGFSLGGLYSQLFLYKLYKKKILDDCYIEYINIESWFGGDKNKYEEFTKIVKIKNIMTFGSLFYLYNKFFQKYNNIDEAVYIDDTDEMIFMKYLKQPFPYGIIDYIKNYHIIGEFLPKIYDSP